jgi:DUF1016 N-terminal domain
LEAVVDDLREIIALMEREGHGEMKPAAKKSTPVRKAGLSGYAPFLGAVKDRIRAAQVRATLAANAELIHLYWDIGRAIAAMQEKEGWGAGVIPRLARDIANDLPEVKGFSVRNIWRMITFAREYPGLVWQRNFADTVCQISRPRRPHKSAAACCTNTMVSPRHPHGERQRPQRPALVCAIITPAPNGGRHFKLAHHRRLW